MEVQLDREVVGRLSYRGILAYVATQMIGEGSWTTSQLAYTVSCNSSLMLEGMQEIHANGLIGKQYKTKWNIGSETGTQERSQVMDLAAARRQDLLDDIKAIFEWANKGILFTMTAADGQAVQRWLKQHKDWTREQWRYALRNRFLSEGIVKAQYIHLWLGRLNEYLEAPLDRYGKVMLNGVGGKIGQAIGVEQGNRSAREQAVAAAGSHA